MKPFLKWAGGKTQMLGELLPRVPAYPGKYIEPFLGGGALYFSLQPGRAVIADRNPELMNAYVQIAENVDAVIELLKAFKNTEADYYAVRDLEYGRLSPAEAAARTIYLNKTCFNGLYRVNRQGRFNTPFGFYKNPVICDEAQLRAASSLLKSARILCGDYLDVLRETAEPGDFIFLDPPYVPVSAYADFKRYTKEQFYPDDHRALAREVRRLCAMGCYVLLTNSNHPLVQELYAEFPIHIVATKRAISSKASSRTGEDVIVTAFPIKNRPASSALSLSPQVSLYPPTRFMGSKSKLLGNIWAAAAGFSFDSALDLFSGSGIVGYMFKAQGKRVISNDYMALSAVFSKAMIENSRVTLPPEEARALLRVQAPSDHFVEKTFAGLYFSDQDNRLIDTLRANIWRMEDEYKRAVALSALIRACLKKRPRGIFTYTGDRYNDGRRDLQLSFEQQFLLAVEAVNGAVFDNGRENLSIQGDAMEVAGEAPDLVYIDPPYYTPLSDNEYVRRYHFVEGLARDWRGVEIQQHTQTKKFKSYPTPFSSKTGAAEAFDRLFEKYQGSILIVSYSSNCQPTREEMTALLRRRKAHVEVIPIDYTYSFANQSAAKTHRNAVQEYLFVGY